MTPELEQIAKILERLCNEYDEIIFKKTEYIEQLELTAKAHHDAIVRVRELHYEILDLGRMACDECLQAYPCPTIRALDGEK